MPPKVGDTSSDFTVTPSSAQFSPWGRRLVTAGIIIAALTIPTVIAATAAISVPAIAALGTVGFAAVFTAAVVSGVAKNLIQRYQTKDALNKYELINKQKNNVENRQKAVSQNKALANVLGDRLYNPADHKEDIQKKSFLSKFGDFALSGLRKATTAVAALESLPLRIVTLNTIGTSYNADASNEVSIQDTRESMLRTYEKGQEALSLEGATSKYVKEVEQKHRIQTEVLNQLGNDQIVTAIMKKGEENLTDEDRKSIQERFDHNVQDRIKRENEEIKKKEGGFWTKLYNGGKAFVESQTNSLYTSAAQLSQAKSDIDYGRSFTVPVVNDSKYNDKPIEEKSQNIITGVDKQIEKKDEQPNVNADVLPPQRPDNTDQGYTVIRPEIPIKTSTVTFANLSPEELRQAQEALSVLGRDEDSKKRQAITSATIKNRRRPETEEQRLEREKRAAQAIARAEKAKKNDQGIF